MPLAEPEVTWTYDPSHYPEPMSPLSADVWFHAMGKGIQAAARELRAPFGGFETATFAGGWAYEHELEPDWEPDPSHFRRAALAVAERWDAEYRARSEAITEEIRRLRPERPPPGEAAAELDRMLELVHEQWRIHFLTVIPVHLARELVHDAYVERFGKGDELEPYRLLEGLPNETLTADEHLWQIAELARELGKTPAEARDFPGFVSNRILMPFINEAAYALLEGVAEAEAIDTIAKLGFNHPLGPLSLADLIGLDTCVAIMEVLHEGLGDPKYAPCPLLRQYVQAGRLGRKSGRGFYEYA